MATLQQLTTAFQFAIGDALNYGQKRYGEKYAQAMDATGCAYQSLANWSWVSNHVPISNRVAGLSWTHHRLVANMGTEQQKQILESAKARGISVTEFEREFLPSNRRQQSKYRMQNCLHRAIVAVIGNCENHRESEFSYPGIRPQEYRAEFNLTLS